MKYFHKKLWIFGLVAIFLFTPISIEAEEKVSTSTEAALKIQQIMDEILENYVGSEDIDEQLLMDAAIKGMFNKLDQYSEYYTPEEYQAFFENVTGEFGGVGIEVQAKDEYIQVVRPLSGTPGEKAGLQPEDMIIGVNGQDIKGWVMDDVVDQIKGPLGTKVTLTIRRGTETFDVELTRETIKVSAVHVESLAEVFSDTDPEIFDGIRYIRIESFNANVAKDLRKALDQAKEEGVKGIIFDVRYNPGGYLNQVVEVARMLVPKGPIVHTINKAGEKETTYSYLEEAPFAVTVLVNEYSASASEIFAGAIQDSGIGKLVGETTYGKGLVQRVYDTGQGTAYKMTIEEYLTRNEAHINEKGIEPDVKVVVPGLITETDKRWKEGEEGKTVYEIEKILQFLGYDVDEADEKYDEKTSNAIYEFQEKAALYPYGVADFTTQDMLNKELADKLQKRDIQLEKAVDVMKEILQQP